MRQQGNELAPFIHDAEVLTDSPEMQNRVIVTVEGNDYQRSLESVGLDFNASEADIIRVMAPIVREQFGADITDYYKVRKAVNNQNIYIIPNSEAGM